MDLSNRVAIITGAASGIGAACARAFAAKGAKVAVVDLNATGAKAIADEIGGLAIGCDIDSEAQVNALAFDIVYGKGHDPEHEFAALAERLGARRASGVSRSAAAGQQRTASAGTRSFGAVKVGRRHLS